MTRFARAKGSKSSNEKAPEDSTPWEVMKEQLIQSKKEADETKNRQQAENLRLENYQNFLKEQKTKKKKATWCDFPETEPTKRNSAPPLKKKKTASIIETADNGLDNKCFDDQTKEAIDISSINSDKKNKKKKKSQKETPVVEEETESLEKNSKKKKKAKDIINDNSNNPAEVVQNKPSFSEQAQKGKKKKRAPTFVDGQPVRRKEINDNSFQLIINGKEVELIRFDGFPIMRKDADRLQELRDNMIKKGIPKSEVQRTMKLERRRAEKALARIKREVCYNCRKGGHNLSDCPELKSKIPGADVADGVCFKCGSTEHKQFECKVQRNGEFKFATCFICKEPGHIARQCPDNPKGLYPNGGGCKLCGDVTHLRKDCPTAKDQKEGTSIKLHTLDGDNIEDFATTAANVSQESTKKPKKIKF